MGIDDLTVEAAFASVFAAAELTPQSVFSDSRIQVWRDLPERQNALFEFRDAGGTEHRWHVKRYLAGYADDLQKEIRGIRLLQSHKIPTVPLIAYGYAGDRAFLISDDLRGYTAGDKTPGEQLEPALRQVVALAAKLHDAGLHHRDLYLCHFFLPDEAGKEIRLIDPGRVARLPLGPLRLRWLIKDVAQLVYSLRGAGLEAREEEVMGSYIAMRNLRAKRLFAMLVRAKVRRIARHDRRVKRRSPGRNVSLDR